MSERGALIDRLAKLFAEWGGPSIEDVHGLLDGALTDVSDAELGELFVRLETTGSDWGYHAPDPVARRISRLVHRIFAGEGSTLLDDGGAAAARRGPVVLLGNHLSFIDANTVDHLLSTHGLDDVTRSLTVLAGPKVYSEPVRRLASLCFGTIKMPQSTSRASGEAVLSRRETLRLAALTLDATRERRARGGHVLIFSEGTRSRSASMQRVLAAIARYVEEPFATIVPFGLHGTEALVPIDDERPHHADVHVRFGAPIDARALFDRARNRRGAIADAIGFLTADLLPPAYRGIYGGRNGDLAAARELADAVRAAG